jgi:hypothetical protein
MARRCGVSKSALAAAVAGYELPSERVAQEFVRACGGEWTWWASRLASAREQLADLASQHSTSLELKPRPPGTFAALAHPASAPSTIVYHGRRWWGGEHALVGIEEVLSTLRRRGCILLALSALALVQAVAIVLIVVFWSAPDSRLAYSATPPAPADGGDPYTAGCGADEQVIERWGIVWPDLQPYGWLTLYNSKKCGASWGSVSGPNSTQWKVYIVAHRPSDGASAPSDFQGDSVRTGSWGNMLLTRDGCVWVEAWIVRDGKLAPAAKSNCAQPNGGPVLHGGPSASNTP